jgi:hypothetical protein
VYIWFNHGKLAVAVAVAVPASLAVFHLYINIFIIALLV